MQRPRAKDQDQELDEDARVLSVNKINYGPMGGEIRLRWRNGVFIVDSDATPGSVARAASEAEAETLFLKLLTIYEAQNRAVSSSPGKSYAPTTFAKDPGARGFGKTALETAMMRLFNGARIRVEQSGPPSKRRSRLVPAKKPDPEQQREVRPASDTATIAQLIAASRASYPGPCACP